MRILLPPSEGKTPAISGSGVNLIEMNFTSLNPAREQVIAALAEVSAHPEALTRLGVGASLSQEVARNTRLLDEPAAPAHKIYSGVLYDALGYSAMTPAARSKADEAVLVISGLWGAVRFADSIPAYRLSMSTTLGNLGRLAAFWKPQLTAALAPHVQGHLLVDCRSSMYAAAWTPNVGNTVSINVFQERNGTRKVVSHFAKHTRGELARHLLTRRGKPPQTPEKLLAAASEKWTAELVPGTAKRPHVLNLILPEQFSTV